jgi:hypothetical protein
MQHRDDHDPAVQHHLFAAKTRPDQATSLVARR